MVIAAPKVGFHIGVFGFSLLILLALVGILLGIGYRASEQSAKTTVNNLSDVISANISEVLHRAEGDLASFSLFIQPEDMSPQLTEGRRKEIEALLEEHLAAFHQISHYRVFNAAGDVIITGGPAKGGFNVADRDWFKDLRDNPLRTLTISDVLIDRASQASIIVLAVPERDESHRFLGAIDAVVDLKDFQRLIDTPRIGRHGAIAIRRSDTTQLIARHPDTLGKLNEPLHSPLTAKILAGETSGQESFVSPMDGTYRVYAFRKTPGYPIATVVGLARDDFLANWKKQAVILGLVAIIASVILAGLFIRQHRTQVSLARSYQHLGKSEARYRTLMHTGSDGIHVLDEHGNLVEASESFLEMLGYTEEESRGLKVTDWDVQFPKDALLAEFFPKLFLTSTRFETKHRRKNGEVIDVEISAEPVTLDGVTYLYASSRDITERKKADESIRLAALVYETSREGMAITTPDGIVINVNTAFTQLTGYSKEEIVGQPMGILKSGRHDKFFYGAMWEELNAQGHWEGEIWNRRKNGEIYPEWLTINTIFNVDGSISRRVALFYDMSAQKQSQDTIWWQANFDCLTGLPNRRMFQERLEQEAKKSNRSDLPLALMLIDLDHFKEVNDSLGHEVGDQLLQEVALRLRNCVRETDTIGRLGGDEFTVILGELPDVEIVERIAQNILETLAKPYQLGETVAYISGSVGITLYPEDAEDNKSLLKQADQAMYEAKHLGRNRFSYFRPGMQEEAIKRLQIGNDLRSALQDNQFRVYYQPIVDLTTGEICKAEALIRWQHPTRGLVSPADFIPIAEDTGAIVDIGEWVFKTAANQIAQWKTSHQVNVQISVNKSPIQFRENCSIHSEWRDYLLSLDLSGSNISVEITEGMLLDASDGITKILLGYRDSGIQVSLDDFGTGYSSLSYLKKFDIDYLKIDQSFVRGLSANSADMAMCEAIIVMAHKLGIKVIAEGIETAEQCDLLSEAGCDFGQGYLFSRPVPAEEFERLFARKAEQLGGPVMESDSTVLVPSIIV